MRMYSIDCRRIYDQNKRSKHDGWKNCFKALLCKLETKCINCRVVGFLELK